MSKKDERQFHIRQLLQEQKKMKVLDLATHFNVSSETIRKDILDLEKSKIISKQQGYITLLEEPDEMPIAIRNQEYMETKQKIMKKSCEYILEDQMIYLDAGSTCQAGIMYLQAIQGITIVTNSIFVAYKCARYNMKVILIGGTVFNNSYRSYGELATETMDYIHIDVAILGSKGLKSTIGFTTSENEYMLKRKVMEQSEKIIVVADHHKFEKEPDFTFCKFKEIDYFITDSYTQENYEQIKDIPHIIKAED